MKPIYRRRTIFFYVSLRNISSCSQWFSCVFQGEKAEVVCYANGGDLELQKKKK